MSLEQALAENTAALKALGTMLSAFQTPASDPRASAKATPTAPATTVVPAPAATPTPAPKETPPATEAKALTYKEVGDVVTAFVKANGKPAAIAILEKFGVATLPGAKPEQWADIIAAFNTAGAQ